MGFKLQIRVKRSWARCALVVLLASIFSSASTPAQDAMERERHEAVFLHNILRFVQWSDPTPPSSFEFCVQGNALLGFALAGELRDARLHGAKVQVRLLETQTDLKACQALVFVGSDPRHVAKQLAALKGFSLITFGDGDQFLQAGGVVAVSDDKGHFQFGVNLEGARAAGIRIDARLLVAKYVVKLGGATGG
jgi:YfiR/HmsC-like